MWKENIMVNFVVGDMSTDIHSCRYILNEKDVPRFDVLE